MVIAAADGNQWELWFTSVPSEQTIDTYLATAFQELADGKSLPFAVVSKVENKIIGTTR